MPSPTYQMCPKCRQQVYTVEPFCGRCGNQYPPVSSGMYASATPPSTPLPTSPPIAASEPGSALQENAPLRWRDLSDQLKYSIWLMWGGSVVSSLWAVDFGLNGHMEPFPRAAIGAIVGIFVACSLQNEPAKIAKMHGRAALGALSRH